MIYTTRTEFSSLADGVIRAFGWQVTADEKTGGGDKVQVVWFYSTAAARVSHVEPMAAIEYFEMCDNLASDPRTARQHIEELLTDADALIFDDTSGAFMSPDEYREALEVCDQMREHEKQESRADIFI